MTELAIIYRDPASLRVNPRNVRRHTDAQIRKIAASIERFGFNNPILIDHDQMVLCGHGRLQAAAKLGMRRVPTVCLAHMTPDQRRAYMIADNKLGDESDFDPKRLAIELQEILAIDNPGFEIIDLGFDMPTVDALIDQLHDDEPEEPAPPEPGDVPAIARRGDLWLLGKNRLFCGDALEHQSYAVLMGDERAQMVFSDPPYNCPINGHVSGKGKVKHREFVMAAGELSDPEFERFLLEACRNMAAFSVSGSIHFLCMDWRQISRLIEVGSEVYSGLKNLCVWNKGHGAMGTLYRSQHELVAVFKNGTAAHINNVQLGKHGRNRTNVWSYRGMSGFQKDRAKKLAAHSTVKPTALVADAMLDCSLPGHIVLDPFAGSGTIFLAAERTNRRGFGIELDPLYVDVALHRFREATGIEPVNAWNGATLQPRRAAPGSAPTIKIDITNRRAS